MVKQIFYNFYENSHDYEDHFEPHSDEIITSDEGYVDVAQQIESMMLAGQLLQESRPNTRNLVFEYDDDEAAYNDFSDPVAVDRRGFDVVDITREVDSLRDRVNNAYRNALELVKQDKAQADKAQADKANVEVKSNE